MCENKEWEIVFLWSLIWLEKILKHHLNQSELILLKRIFGRKINCLSSKFYQQNHPTLFSSVIRVCPVRNWKICCNGSFSVSLDWFGFFVLFWFCCLVYFPALPGNCRRGSRRANSTCEIQQPSLPILGWRFLLRECPEAAQTHTIFLQNGQSSKSKRGRFHTTATFIPLQRQR